MGFTGVNISRTNNFGGATNIADNVGLLIIAGAVATSQLALHTAAGLLSVSDAVDKGIDPAYDDTNSILAYHHIDEFFRVAPEAKLYIVLDDGNMTAEQLKAIFKENQDISFAGMVRNSATAPADFAAFAGNYQNVLNDLRAEGRFISSFIVEAAEFDAAKLISAYADMRALNAPQVSVVLSQDPVIRGLKTAYETYAAVGTALGSVAVRKVNENIGSVDIEAKPRQYKGTQDYTLTNAGRQRWMGAVLQSGKNANELTATEITALNDKGYLFVAAFNGYQGFFWSDSHVAVTAASDYARIENNRVFDKAALLIRKALLPKVKSNIAKNPQTGFIDSATATELEALAEKKLGQMVADRECSGVGVYINPEQSLTTGTPLVVQTKVVHNDIIHEFDVQLGLTDKL